MVPSSRNFLFLQGLASWFFERLGQSLAAHGHTVRRINFNGGDRAFWRLPGATDFCGRAEDWPAFLDRLIVDEGIGDIILFGDCRPLHRAAIGVARTRGVKIHVVEEGYLRPDWITFEEGGVNGYSGLPSDPSWYREEARGLPDWQEPPPVPGRFRRRAWEDVRYTLSVMAAARRFPHYATHRPYHPLIEYAGWLRRLALARGAERSAMAAVADIRRCPGPVFFFPLQLDCDSQIRVHSSYRAMYPAIEHVLTSFAQHAPAAARLVVKLHPFDSGLCDWAAMTSHLAAAHGIAGRVIIVDGGEPVEILRMSRGVVTVNSTVGSLALRRGLPVIALGKAVYDLPGLTFQGPLDDFWNEAAPPDAALFDAFRRVLAARVLIPGSFFNDTGLRLAVDAAVDRLEAALRPARTRAVMPPAAAISAPIAAAAKIASG